MRISDWSSDVCSSDLDTAVLVDEHEDGTSHRLLAVHAARARAQITANPDVGDLADSDRNAAARCRNGVDRKRVVYGKSVSVRVDLGGRRIIKKQTTIVYQGNSKHHILKHKSFI